MNITAELLLDSITPKGNRLTTWILRYPRFIHAEFMTHRAFSRNAASSRAIPIHKMRAAVERCPATPEFWGTNKPGMQAGSQLDGVDRDKARLAWNNAALEASILCGYLNNLGLHKQIANCLLEPFAHITVIMTTGEAGLLNFFGLRAHPDAQPEFQVLAYKMLELYLSSHPDALSWGDWHVPFGGDVVTSPDRLKIATGRIARVSYLTHDGVRDLDKDIELHDRLATSGHWSPFEHCAQASDSSSSVSNLGPRWHQYRKNFVNEVQHLDRAALTQRLSNRPNWIS
jgi:thymidylate synthase ThyX